MRSRRAQTMANERRRSRLPNYASPEARAELRRTWIENPEDIVALPQIAEALQIPKTTLRDWVKYGYIRGNPASQLPVLKVNHKFYTSRGLLNRFFADFNPRIGRETPDRFNPKNYNRVITNYFEVEHPNEDLPPLPPDHPALNRQPPEPPVDPEPAPEPDPTPVEAPEPRVTRPGTPPGFHSMFNHDICSCSDCRSAQYTRPSVTIPQWRIAAETVLDLVPGLTPEQRAQTLARIEALSHLFE